VYIYEQAIVAISAWHQIPVDIYIYLQTHKKNKQTTHNFIHKEKKEREILHHCQRMQSTTIRTIFPVILSKKKVLVN